MCGNVRYNEHQRSESVGFWRECNIHSFFDIHGMGNSAQTSVTGSFYGDALIILQAHVSRKNYIESRMFLLNVSQKSMRCAFLILPILLLMARNSVEGKRYSP